jgi:uncharacterized OsmC-like protein
MEVEVLHLGEVRFEAIARGHRVICDQPATIGGSDSGMTPPEFLLVSLGTCAGYYAAQYLKTRSLPTDGLRVKVAAEKATQPARIGRFQVIVTTPELNAKDQAGILRAVKSCLIHATLLNEPAVDIVLNAPVGVPAA